jgi:hypothetical protein
VLNIKEETTMKLNELMKLEEAALKAETAQEGKEWV